MIVLVITLGLQNGFVSMETMTIAGTPYHCSLRHI